ncbi:MAG TPA: hypothetical protein VF092_01250 [Longimicrobium sp.]
MWITHSYMGTVRGRTRCLFFLLFEDYIEAQHGLSDQVRTELERFARNLGNAGAVVIPFPGDAPATHTSVLEKGWTEKEILELRQTPAMLMIDTDFDEFDPRHHSWVLFHFDRSSSYDGAYAPKLRSLFNQIAAAASNGEADPFAIVQASMRTDAIARASKIVKLEPGAFGFSIDLRAGWAALKQYLRTRSSRGDEHEREEE